jgi:hypothetical protein
MLLLLDTDVTRRRLGFEVAAHLYRRQREGKTITKYFAHQKKARAINPALVAVQQSAISPAPRQSEPSALESDSQECSLKIKMRREVCVTG